MAERIKNEIIWETGSASQAILVLSKKVNDYSKELLKVALSEAKASREVDKARVFFDKLAGSTSKATKSQKQLTAAVNAGTAASRKNTAQIRKQKKSADDLGISWTSVKRIFAGQIIFRVLSAFTNQLRDSVGAARELEVKLAEAITIAPGALNLSIEGIKQLGDEVRELSESFGVDQVELATAAYQVYSNQIGTAAESTEFLRVAVEFAKATVTNTASSVDLLSGVINSYGLEAKAAARVSDVFTKAVELGRFRIDDIANSMGRVNPIAATLGISIEEVAAALATLTIKGVSPDKALTQLLAVMLKMVKPSRALTKALSEIGFSNIKAATSTLGLVGTLKALTATTDGTIEAIGRMFPRVRGIQAVLGLVNDEGERFNSIYTEIQDTADGATKKYAAFILATQSEELKRNIQAIKNFFVEDFGKSIIKTINDILEAMGGIPGAVEKMQKAVQLLTIALAGLVLQRVAFGFIAVSAGMASTTGAATVLLAVLSKLPFAALALGAAALGQGIAFLVNQYLLGGAEADRFAAEQKRLEQATKELATSVAEASIIQLDAIRKSSLGRIDAVLDGLRRENEAYADQTARIRFLGIEVTQDLTAELGRRLKSFEDFAKDSTNALELAARDVARIDSTIAKIKSRTEQELFDISIRNFSKRAKREARAARVSSLLARARVAGSKEEQTELLRAAGIEASRAQSGTLVKRVSDAKIKALSVEQRALRRNAVMLDRMAPSINKATTEMRLLREEAKGLAEELEKAVSNVNEKKIRQIGDQLLQIVKDFEKQQRSLETLLGRSFGVAVTGLREGLRNALSDPMKISFKIDQALKEVAEKLKSRKISTKLFLQIAPLGGTPETSFEAATGLLNAQKEQVKRELQELQDLLVTGIPKVVIDAKAEVLKALENIPKIDANVNLFGFFVPDFEKTKNALAQQAELLGDLKALLVTFKSFLDVDEINLDDLEKVFDLINESAGALKGAGQSGAAEALEALRKKFQEVLNTAAKAKQGGLGDFNDELIKAADKARELSQVAPSASTGLENLAIAAGAGAIGMAGLAKAEAAIGPTAQTASDQAVTALNSIGPAARSQIEGVQALAAELRALAAARSAAAVTAATGGQIPSFLASGGPTQSRGTDTVAVQAAPGEMFINAASTRRFIPELTAINQGKSPEPRNNSQVTNNSFSGDININVPPGTKIDGRQMSQDIRRELRRKTSSLS